jgi:hypothetical protein
LIRAYKGDGLLPSNLYRGYSIAIHDAMNKKDKIVRPSKKITIESYNSKKEKEKWVVADKPIYEGEDLDFLIESNLLNLDEAETEDRAYPNIKMRESILKKRNLNSSQKITLKVYYNRYGNLQVTTMGNTYLASNIANRRIRNFGSVEQLRITNLPESLFRLKGTEITMIKQIGLAKDKKLIRRGFLTRVAQEWSYITDMLYITHNDDKTNVKYYTTLDLWATKVTSGNDNSRVTYLLTGQQVIDMLEDIIFLIRAKSLNNRDLDKHVSPQLKGVIEAQLGSKSYKEILDDFRDRLFYRETIYSKNGKPLFVWAFPKLSISMIKGYISQLRQECLLDICIPLIKDTRNYPIKCSDTQVRPMTDEEHEDNLEKYDGQVYIEERD